MSAAHRALDAAVVSVHTPMFDALTGHGVIGRAHAAGLWRLQRFDPRDHAENRHRSVDDRPYGGGPGMVMSAAPLAAAIDAASSALCPGSAAGAEGEVAAHVVCMSPQGAPLEQRDLPRLLARRRLVLVCGRYEGIDQRLVDQRCDEEISLGDFVLSGGELAAMALLDALVRLLDGALHHAGSAQRDSFATDAAGLLDCPHYTRPERFGGEGVPAVLLGGDHERVDAWRRAAAVAATRRSRPGLLERRRREGLLTGPWRRAAEGDGQG